VVSDDAFLATQVLRLIALAAERRVPAIYPFSDSVMQGGLMAYSANFFEIWRQAAGYVDRILKGAGSADLPIEQATNFALKVNLKTAKALAITIPPSIMVRAEEVIEEAGASHFASAHSLDHGALASNHDPRCPPRRPNPRRQAPLALLPGLLSRARCRSVYHSVAAGRACAGDRQAHEVLGVRITEDR
jgi:hypothetical protein